MIDTERREAARQFINRWRGKGKEDEDGRSYWIELLSNIFGVENVTERIYQWIMCLLMLYLVTNFL